MPLRILHIDMDAFFAAVEVVRDPSLRGKSLIIGGGEADLRGVVSTASYEARKFGVHSAMPLAQARKLCPKGIYMRGNYAAYREASGKVRAILETLSPLVQMASIDEAYVDVTGSQKLFGGDDAIAAYLKEEIRRQTDLPCTIAISPNKLISKVASDFAKPDGYIRIREGEEAAFLAPLAVRKLPGAGPRTCEMLESLGILTIGQLAAASTRALEGLFGQQLAVGLQRAACGISNSTVEVDRAPKSISRETTFEEDLTDWKHIEHVLASLTERCMHSLRAEGLEAKRVTLKVRYSDFETKTFARTLPETTCVDKEVLDVLRELLPKGKERRARVRLIGVNLSMLSYNQHQLPLFGAEQTEKWQRVLERMDGVREKFGFESVHLGGALGKSNADSARTGKSSPPSPARKKPD